MPHALAGFGVRPPWIGIFVAIVKVGSSGLSRMRHEQKPLTKPSPRQLAASARMEVNASAKKYPAANGIRG